ncbi:MAG: FitA-like ribbon-helix-helix domain-containing protein [Acidimicrobiia bacterium]
MAKTIQIRNVPDGIHRELRARAARADMSLSDYLLEEVTRFAARPSIADVLLRASARPGGVSSSEAVVGAIREGREDR